MTSGKNIFPYANEHWGSEAGSGRTAESRKPLSSAPGELRASEEQFKAFFEHANVGATQLEPTGRFVAVNARFCEITGYTREELLAGMTPLDLSYPDDRERDREHLMPFVEGKTSAYEVESVTSARTVQ